MIFMIKSQQFGFLLLELLCAISLFMLATTAAGGLLAQLICYQKTIDERLMFLASVTQLLETGVSAESLIAQEVKRVRVDANSRQFHVSTLQVQAVGAEQKLMVTQCAP